MIGYDICLEKILNSGLTDNKLEYERKEISIERININLGESKCSSGMRKIVFSTN